MKTSKIIMDGKEIDLEGLVKRIDTELGYVSELGKGGYGIVLKVKGDNHYRLKVCKGGDVPGSYRTLEREYKVLEDLAETGAVPKPIKLYEDAQCALYGTKGKCAYLTELIEGETLSKTKILPSKWELERGLNYLIERIRKGGYAFSGNSDFNADNILIGKDGRLYLLDPMLLVPVENLEKKPLFGGKTDEEKRRVEEMVRRYGS